MMNQNKIGFWAVFALVTGSQIGSGIFMLPGSLAAFGIYGIIGWLFSGLGAVLLALVFASLCEKFPTTGGPHVYVSHVFGKRAAFFTGWTYWIISWVSTVAVLAACAGYLAPLIGLESSETKLFMQVFLLVAVTVLNMWGVGTAGRVEKWLTFLKFVPLIVIPAIGLFFFKFSNIALEPSYTQLSVSTLLSRVATLTFWCFIGFESATAPAGSVINARRTIPLAIVSGTVAVAVLYLFNSIGVMGALPSQYLMTAGAPYAATAQLALPGAWHLLVSLIAAIVCLGTLNAWTVTSSQIALGLAQGGLFPQVFGATNKHGAPIAALLISSIGMLPLLWMTADQGLTHQVTAVIDFSVTAFLFVYLMCCLSFLALVFKERGGKKDFIIGSLALLFCLWLLANVTWQTLLISTFFTVVGIPFYLYWHRH